MKSWIAILISMVFLATVSLIVILSYGDNTGSQTSCKDTSETVGEYNLCLALERCHDEFKDNSALRDDCLYNVFYQAYK